MSKIENAVRAKIAKRAELGLGKYGVTLADAPMSMMQILQHIQDEAMDTANYCEKAMQMLAGDGAAGGDIIPWSLYPNARWAMALTTGEVFYTDAKERPTASHLAWNIVGQENGFYDMDNARISGPWNESLRARPVGV